MMRHTCTIGGSGVGCGLLEEAEVRVQSPGVVVDLKQNLVVDKEPIPTALRVRVERLPKITKHES
jgi:hypothetical protein